ncbi:NAD-dependent DNA ligase LigA [Malacoplasma iowae]|uniref:NAD-dependent DNA ligase LigA n=1 Tax=Malacoplasma iowae TaxID=2116 RepID=UPI002A186C0A|nr:NAD-dependent DNA ligase LigA [Malacoplasma iowae]WPL38075.1 NAD-dependent DNA ligase LigA [Malacoplasma iowae]
MNKENIKKEIEILKQNLKQWEYEYYGLENPTVSDYEYDQALKKLISLEIAYPEFKTDDSPSNRVGGYISEKFSKVKHKYPMLSLSNAFDKNDLIKFDADIKKELNVKEVEYVVEPKIDGLSISLIYKNGKLLQAITRGDGVIGEDVTANVKTIKTIPLTIDYQDEIEIRGEIFLTKADFLKINNDKNLIKKFANARNAASGSLRNLDTSITASRNLTGYFYYVPNSRQLNINKQYDVLKWLSDHKILTSKDIIKAKNIDEVIQRVEELTKLRDSFKYDIDGIVIKVNNIDWYEEIGYTSKFPKWATAYKFPANIKTSTLNSIDVTVGRTGRINFIANITPIELDGSIISKATLHNAEYIIEKDIRINDVVEIYKAGDIIPKIIKPIKEERNKNSVEWKPPLHCPCCNSVLVKFENEVDQYCINTNCEDKIIQQISHFCSRDAMNVDGLSEAIIEKFYKNNLINNVANLYEIKNKKEAILNLDILIKEKAFNNIVNAIEKTKENSLEKLIFGLGIRHVGFNVAKLVAKRFKSINGIINASVDDILSIGEVGEKIAISITNWFNDIDNIKTIKRLKEYGVNFNYINEYADFVVSPENEKYKNKSFVITGSFEKNRNEIKNILESVYHAKVTSSVTKNTDYLIIGNSPTQNKIEKAKSLNIPIIEKPFWNN